MAAWCTYHRPTPSCQTRAMSESLSLNEMCRRIYWVKSQKHRPASRKKVRTESNGSRQNKRGDSKVASNDIPEIPDRGETSDILGLICKADCVPFDIYCRFCSLISREQTTKRTILSRGTSRKRRTAAR